MGRAEGLLFILMQPVVKKLLVDLRLIDFVDYDFLCFCMNNGRCWTLVYKLRPVSLLFWPSNVFKVVTLFSSCQTKKRSVWIRMDLLEQAV